MTPETGGTRCPDPSRFWEVAAGGSWESEERVHVGACLACQAAERAIRSAIGQAGERAELSGDTAVATSGDPAASGPTQARALFLQEVEGLQSLSHPGLCPIPELRTKSADETRREIDTSDYGSGLESTLRNSGTFPVRNASIEADARSSRQLPRELGNYEVVKQIGAGGMGVVYKVRDIALNRVAALKIIRHFGAADGLAMDRFFRAARLWARLRHPSIGQVYEVNQVDGIPYIISQFIDGENLSELLKQEKPISDREAAGIIARVADALEFAHREGIVHRDIKPSNIMVERDGNPFLIDFGLARSVVADDEASVTADGQIIGSPGYMSPEQTLGQPNAVGPASDVYSLGCTLYTLLTGRPPFRGHSVIETFTLIRESEPIPPTRLGLKVPPDLETICLKALAKEPSQRYSSAREMADDLRRFMEGEPIRARSQGVSIGFIGE